MKLISSEVIKKYTFEFNTEEVNIICNALYDATERYTGKANELFRDLQKEIMDAIHPHEENNNLWQLNVHGAVNILLLFIQDK